MVKRFPRSGAHGIVVSKDDMLRVIREAVIELLGPSCGEHLLPLTEGLLAVLKAECGIVPDEHSGLRGNWRQGAESYPTWRTKDRDNMLKLLVSWHVTPKVHQGVTLTLRPSPTACTTGPLIDGPANDELALALARYARAELGPLAIEILDAGGELVVGWNRLHLERLTRIDYFFENRILERARNRELIGLLIENGDFQAFEPDPRQGWRENTHEDFPSLYIPESSEAVVEQIWLRRLGELSQELCAVGS
ncbi:hypothetical protein KW800_02115 [Candidatus Parcubacteria bacterium]|nr:hypothetical protein [Candidatus Parcubacteria bacterium]